MQIETTINIKLNLLLKITDVSAAYSTSLNRIITKLIYKLINSSSIKTKLFDTVKYQKTGDEVVWHTLHVSFSNDIYEKALDLRKVLKMSVSYIVARAIELYLEDLIKDLSKKNNTDKNLQDYVFISSKCNGLLCFSIFWTTPPKKILKKYTRIHKECNYIVNN